MRWMVLAMVMLLGACASDDPDVRRHVTWSIANEAADYGPALQLVQAESLWRARGVDLVLTDEPGADVVVELAAEDSADGGETMDDGTVWIRVAADRESPHVVATFAHQLGHVILPGDVHLPAGQRGILAAEAEGGAWSEDDMRLLVSYGLGQ